MVDRLEAEAQQALLQREQRVAPSHSLHKRTGSPNPPISTPPAHTLSPRIGSPPPANEAYEELTVDTCNGPAIIRLPLVPGEDEFSRETRIFELENKVQRIREQEEIARMAASIRAAHPETVPAPNSPPSLVPPIPTSCPPSPSLVPPEPAPTYPPPFDVRSVGTPLQRSSGLSSPPTGSPNSEVEDDNLFLNDPFRLSAVRKTREPSIFPPLAAYKLETLSNNRPSALDYLAGYEDDDIDGSIPDEGANSMVGHLPM